MKRFLFILALGCALQPAFAQIPALPERELGNITNLPARRHAVSVEFLAPLFRHFTVGHEMELKQDISLESKVGVIFSGAVSMSDGQNYNQTGGFIRTGVKFYRDFPQRNFLFWGERERGPRGTFEGRYIKPELVLGYFTEDIPIQSAYGTPSTATNRQSTFAAAILVNFGRQYLYGKRLLVGYECGLGYAFSNEDMNQINNGGSGQRPYGWYYSHVGAPNSEFPIAFSVGFNVGLLLGK